MLRIRRVTKAGDVVTFRQTAHSHFAADRLRQYIQPRLPPDLIVTESDINRAALMFAAADVEAFRTFFIEQISLDVAEEHDTDGQGETAGDIRGGATKEQRQARIRE